MRAVVCHEGELSVGEVPDPVPARGQLLLEVEACGICGSDLHARTNGEEMAADAATSGYDGFMRSHERIVMGHEFSGRVLESRGGRFKEGDPVVAMPLLRADGAIHTTGLSAHAPGAYAEKLLVQASVAMRVPNGLDLSLAALTEPMGIALHAVRRSDIGARQTAYVIGCGPIGLGVIAMLKVSGVRTVVASDPSPTRRLLAEKMGADVVVDPGVSDPFAERTDGHVTAPELFELAIGTMEKLRKIPGVPWSTIMRGADRAGLTPGGPVVFECVGVPGMLAGIIADAPLYSRVVVVGVCMADDAIRPAVAINKEIDLRFVLGYTPEEFNAALYHLAGGNVDPSPLVTGHVGLEGVAGAFADLGDPERHAKILVEPNG